MDIRLITEKDYKNVADMIARSVSNSAFTRFYPQQSIDYIKKSLDENGVKQRASWTHFYVIEKDNEIIACGAIGPYWDSKTESSLFNIFVDEKYQGQGFGRKIIETLENDEFFKRAKRIEVPASMSAIPFYRKMGYEHKNGELIYDDGHFSLEKFNL
ncbi:MAG: GNAT family N-acetyltransferase [Clostridia bacterium]|nr:GNAT family N-acetyltransferase [Clostridia bacterium]